MASGLTTRITEGRLQHRYKHFAPIFFYNVINFTMLLIVGHQSILFQITLEGPAGKPGVNLRFKSDRSLQLTGWKLTWTAIPDWKANYSDKIVMLYTVLSTYTILSVKRWYERQNFIAQQNLTAQQTWESSSIAFIGGHNMQNLNLPQIFFEWVITCSFSQTRLLKIGH